jgi:hypothetical protein
MSKQRQRKPVSHAHKPNLYELLQTLPDRRRGQGKMHALAPIFLIMIMAILSGCIGQRATGDFVQRHRKALLKLFKQKQHRLPSRQTISRVIQQTDFDVLSALFSSWVMSHKELVQGSWIAIDGKAIGGTLQGAGTSYQQFTSLVSFFSHTRKEVVAQGRVHTKSNEIPLVQQLLEELDLEACVFTLDALHCQKATTKAIMKSKNDYVIGVKENQPTLLKTLKKRAARQHR